jgi:anti-sigma regulatory factor (Ser/Thr protein kinase)
MTAQPFSLTVPADIAEIPAISLRLEESLLSYGFTPEEVLDTQLAVEELITNIAVHGYRGTGGPVTVSCSFEDDHAVIQLADSAPAFDPLSVPEPDIDADVSDRKIGGLGIYLVRQVMDGISYRFENGSNILTLKKKR